MIRSPDERDWAGRRAAGPMSEQVGEIRRRARAIQVYPQVLGWRCDDCDLWRSRLEAGKLRFGCPRCGSRSFTRERAVVCPRCQSLVPNLDWSEHQEVCS